MPAHVTCKTIWHTCQSRVAPLEQAESARHVYFIYFSYFSLKANITLPFFFLII